MTITTTRDVEDLDALAARMAPLADEATWHVHQRDPDAIADLMVPLSVLELRALVIVLAEVPGWPTPEDPDSDQDTDLDGRDHLAGRLPDEVDWLQQCPGWLRQLDGVGGAWSVPAARFPMAELPPVGTFHPLATPGVRGSAGGPQLRRPSP